MGHEILFGAPSFIVDDSAWLRDNPLDVEALPRRGATHFRAGARGILLLQQSAPVSTYTAVTRRNKRPPSMLRLGATRPVRERVFTSGGSRVGCLAPPSGIGSD
ncbi:hypothetical protein ZWY2020_021767 [Hordeum vulgare]|nr:hypothetical protein ZWY2020_021767 [Hordeum vulgare]